MPHLKVPFTFYCLSINISTWDTTLGPSSSQFWVDDVATLSQASKFIENGFINE